MIVVTYNFFLGQMILLTTMNAINKIINLLRACRHSAAHLLGVEEI